MAPLTRVLTYMVLVVLALLSGAEYARSLSCCAPAYEGPPADSKVPQNLPEGFMLAGHAAPDALYIDRAVYSRHFAAQRRTGRRRAGGEGTI